MTNSNLIDSENMTIDFDAIDKDSFIEGYANDLMSCTEGESIIVLFTEEGEYAGEVREHNAGYSVSDLHTNENYRIEGEADEYFLDELKTEVRESL